MPEHPFLRLPTVANMFGLLLGSIGIIIGGQQVNSGSMTIVGHIALFFFTVLFTGYLCLLIRDSINMTRKHGLRWLTPKLNP